MLKQRVSSTIALSTWSVQVELRHNIQLLRHEMEVKLEKPRDLIWSLNREILLKVNSFSESIFRPF